MAEFSRTIRVDEVGQAPRREHLVANADERSALAERFDLVSIKYLEADLTIRREAAGIRVAGQVRAEAAQSCVLSGEPVPARIDETLELLFVEDLAGEEVDEIELSEAECDRMPIEGGTLDLGEVAAQTLYLALEPYPRAPDHVLAEARRHLISEEEATARTQTEKVARNPFRVLQGRGNQE